MPVFINKIVNMESESYIGLIMMGTLILGFVIIGIRDEIKKK
jgi:hypothetical protein